MAAHRGDAVSEEPVEPVEGSVREIRYWAGLVTGPGDDRLPALVSIMGGDVMVPFVGTGIRIFRDAFS